MQTTMIISGPSIYRPNWKNMSKLLVKTIFNPDFDQAPVTRDLIECPKCGHVQVAEIVEGKGGAMYGKQCVNCGHVITKKDWKSVK